MVAKWTIDCKVESSSAAFAKVRPYFGLNFALSSNLRHLLIMLIFTRSSGLNEGKTFTFLHYFLQLSTFKRVTNRLSGLLYTHDNSATLCTSRPMTQPYPPLVPLHKCLHIVTLKAGLQRMTRKT